ncbi:recombinase family protein [Rhodocytophaga aerolata]|uniref:Recombinase family protein n=1 Tax=Rhodocytophaga aerolata TaxID=455078 RepID=A0ABT8RKV2_9BACT|nr:recombinase family protein [Rhodocytophaga aerolata]MDO1451840.1 recombinase family protein [Rhodocytophaga aerolata]
MKKYVSYFRVSTFKQGQSGLGMAAQRRAVAGYVKDPTLILEEFVEVESGKNDDRPELYKAIDVAKLKGACLLIAKLDRLSRDAAFIFTLRKTGVDFVCADMPEANTLTIGIFAVLAQHERELISSRTKAALSAKKERGEKMGKSENFHQQGRCKGATSMKRLSVEAKENRQAIELIRLYRRQKNEKGRPMTFEAIAHKLNAAGFITRRGKVFTKGWVKQLYDRL